MFVVIESVIADARWLDSAPRRIELTHVDTGEVHATLTFLRYKPLSDRLGRLEFDKASNDPLWNLVVVGSAMAEAANIGKIKWTGGGGG